MSGNFLAGALFTVVAAAVLQSVPCTAATLSDTSYIAGLDIRRDRAVGKTVNGTVFNDLNHNGRLDAEEPGLKGVKVSNGYDVTVSDDEGHYRLPVRDDMAVSVIQPSGWRVPTDQNFVPQFAYQHKPKGSPKALRYGGLPPTGELPSAINFPLTPSTIGRDFHCAVLGDVQVYSGDEIGFARDSIVHELMAPGRKKPDCIVAMGDEVGDDLGLIPRLESVMGAMAIPQWWVQGNHDYDSDADHDKDSSDTWRRLYGPNYYAFEMGNVLFIALDNVVYPCGKEDDAGGKRPFCTHYVQKSYNGRIPDEQMRFVKNVLKHTDPNKLVVVMHHIPLVGFDNRKEWAHQTENVGELYALLKGRKALDLSGHSHSLENLAPGDSFFGWQKAVGINTIPFRHLVAGAVAGDWWGGDYDVRGIPISLQGEGTPRGFVDFDIKGTDYTLDYRATGLPRETAMWLSINTPAFRHWMKTIRDWREQKDHSAIPPLSSQDLQDEKLLTTEDLKGASRLTANVWMGDTTTKVTVSIDGGPAVEMTRTQTARGDDAHEGPEYADPFALKRQYTVARTAIQSQTGAPGTQGYVQGRQPVMLPSPPQPQGSTADHNMHLWRYQLPADLPLGVHTAKVKVTRDQGETATDTMVFEVLAERPPRSFRFDAWNAFHDGPRVAD